jgi:hypothetical protein
MELRYFRDLRVLARMGVLTMSKPSTGALEGELQEMKCRVVFKLPQGSLSPKLRGTRDHAYSKDPAAIEILAKLASRLLACGFKVTPPGWSSALNGCFACKLPNLRISFLLYIDQGNSDHLNCEISSWAFRPFLKRLRWGRNPILPELAEWRRICIIINDFLTEELGVQSPTWRTWKETDPRHEPAR